MAGLFLESFDTIIYSQILQRWTQLSGAIQGGLISLTPAAGARGTYGIQFFHNSIVGSTGALSITLAPASNIAIIGAAFSTDSFNTDGNLIGGVTAGAILTIQDQGEYQLRLKTNLDGTLGVWGGGDASLNGATLLGSSTAALQAGVQYYIWLKATIDHSGSILVQVNGDIWLSKSANTQYSANTTYKWNQLGIGPASGINTYNFDDVGMLDGSGTNNDIPCGVLEVQAWYPTAAGTYSQYTPLTGINLNMINEGSPTGGIGNDGDNTYNQTTTIGARDSFTFPALTDPTASVIFVQRNIVARSPSGGSSSMAGSYRTATINYDGASTGLTTSYADVNREVLDINPAGGVWTPAAVSTPNEWGYTKKA